MTGLIERNTLLRPRIQRHRRLKYGMQIEVRADLAKENARTHDISAGGLFVDSEQAYQPGMLVRLLFCLDQRDFETRARIVHVRPAMGFGAEFIDLSHEERNHILRFVHRERATREAERVLKHDAWTRPR